MELASAVELAMYSETLAELDRAALRRLLEDLEDDGVAVREAYSRHCNDMWSASDEWDKDHAVIVAERDASLAKIKVQIARIHRALDLKRETSAEAKAARKATRK